MMPVRFALYGVGTLLLFASIWGYGHTRYVAGQVAERAVWQPQLFAAEKAAAEANARTASIESAQTAATAAAEARHAETVAALNTRAADADRRIRALSVRLAANRSRRCNVPGVPGPATQPDAAPSVDDRIERAGSAIADTGRRCESDASQLAEIQQWVREQQALRR